MLYLIGPSKAFFLGFVEESEPVATLLEGNSIKGIISKAEIRCETQHDAWDRLCEQAAGFFKAGYIAEEFPGLDKFLPPEKPFVGLYPEHLQGVHVRFTKLSQEHFEAGLARLQAVHNVLRYKFPNVGLKVSESGFEFTSDQQKVAFTKLSSAAWENYGARAQEIFEDRKSIDSTTLLPSGDGEWWVPTQGDLLDVYLRAFLGQVHSAGGSFVANGGKSWTFDIKKPFESATVSNLSWFQKHPDILNELGKADLLGGLKLKIAPAVQTTAFAFFL